MAAASGEPEAGGGPSETERRIRLLREGTEAYNRQDFGWVFEHSAEGIEVHTGNGLVNSGDFRGKDRFRIWMREWQEAWSEMTITIRDVHVFDDRFLLVDVTQTGTGSLSGIETTMEIVQVLEIKDEEIARFHLYPGREQAMAAIAELRRG